jgi:hypothetical protein
VTDASVLHLQDLPASLTELDAKRAALLRRQDETVTFQCRKCIVDADDGCSWL